VRSWSIHIAWSVAILIGIITIGHPGRAQQAEDESASVESGKAVVVGAPGIGPSQACVNCHGTDGKGDYAAGFPRLAGQSKDYLIHALQEYAAGNRGNPVMSPIASSLSERQMRDVAAYYASLSDVPWERKGGADPELLQYGAALSAIGSASLGIQGCMNCHGPAGQGLPPNYPYLAGQPAAFLTSRLQELRSRPDSEGISMPQVMSHIAKRMEEREMEAVSQYFSSIPPAPVQAADPSGARAGAMR